jgi:hypothetical protein
MCARARQHADACSSRHICARDTAKRTLTLSASAASHSEQFCKLINYAGNSIPKSLFSNRKQQGHHSRPAAALPAWIMPEPLREDIMAILSGQETQKAGAPPRKAKKRKTRSAQGADVEARGASAHGKPPQSGGGAAAATRSRVVDTRGLVDAEQATLWDSGLQRARPARGDTGAVSPGLSAADGGVRGTESPCQPRAGELAIDATSPCQPRSLGRLTDAECPCQPRATQTATDAASPRQIAAASGSIRDPEPPRSARVRAFTCNQVDTRTVEKGKRERLAAVIGGSETSTSGDDGDSGQPRAASRCLSMQRECCSGGSAEHRAGSSGSDDESDAGVENSAPANERAAGAASVGTAKRGSGRPERELRSAGKRALDVGALHRTRAQRARH